MAATGTLGRIEEFDGSGDWSQYAERLENFFAANDIVDADKKRAVFLSVVGASTYKILRDLVTPVKPAEKPLAELLAALAKHFNPKPSEIVERFKFHSRVRKPGESVAKYVAELRSLTEFCNFGNSLELMIRDRLVCGINDAAIQTRLLADTELTYDKAVSIALNAETATQSVRELRVKQESGVTHQQQSVHKTGVQQSSSQASPVAGVTCFRCGWRGHTVVKCRVKRDVVCHLCGKRGHLQRICKSRDKGKTRTVGHVKDAEEQEEQDASDSDDPTNLCHLRSSSGMTHTPPMMVKVRVDDCEIDMEVDTGASHTLMSESTFTCLWPGRSLHHTPIRLQSYSKQPIPVLGCCSVNIHYQGQTGEMPLLIVGGSGPTLLGRDWLGCIRLNWGEIHQVHLNSLQKVLRRYPSVFQEGLGTLKGFQAKIYVDPDAPPRFYPARSIPYAYREMVEQELQRLQENGTIEPVDFADWASPIVVVLKRDKSSVRICGDFSVTINPVSKLDRYPIPKVEDLFAKLRQGKYFSNLDLSHAYQQLPLDEESRKYVVINTHRGLFKFTRLPFGISSAPGIFQRAIESLLQGIPGVVVYLDDILVTGSTEEEHLKTLDEVLSRLDSAGLRVKSSKCAFMRESVTYLGHQIDSEGLHPLSDRIKAIREAPTPTSVSTLKSYLGMLSYYSKFLPSLSTVLHPLYKLLRKNTTWRWGEGQAKAFQASKEMLTSESCLTHFNSSLELILACDASPYGIGAVLSHRMSDGSERPIGYASRTLNNAEQNYSQLEKEGLSCIFGIRKFHHYLFGHSFQLVTDHKPLLGLLKEDRAVSSQASARIKRWSLFLSSYEYTLSFRNTTAHGNADALSRLPLPEEPATTAPVPELVLLAEHLDDSPVTAADIRAWTCRDRKLSRVLQYIQRGWPSNGDPELEPFSSRRLELSSFDGCIMWGTRIVIPSRGRQAVLQELHEGHPGITKMKGLARMYVWWPGITADIEQSVRLCRQCQEVQSSPPLAPLNPWRWPTRPWARLHLDFAGPFQGKMILVAIDAHSKWIEAVCTSTTSSAVVIEELRTLFAKFGLPESVVTDNGTGFTSQEFKGFLQANGIRHTTSAPYHPASNGLAERAVQVVKKGLKKVTSGSMTSRLAKVLFTYRITPHSTTGISPAELLLGRQPRTRLDLLRPNTAARVEGRQLAQKEQHDSKSRSRLFEKGDHVMVRNQSAGPKWLPGVIVERSGPVSFHVQLEDGRRRRCHQDQLLSRTVDVRQDDENEVSSNADSTPTLICPVPPGPEQSEPAATPVQLEANTEANELNTESNESNIVTSDQAPTETNERRYPRRTRTVREHFEPGHN